jgi:PKD repeat protein
MKKRIILYSAILMLLCLPCVLASFQYHNNTLKTNYVGGEKIQGILTVSLTNQSVDSYITTNLGGNISIIDFIRNNSFTEGKDYNCSTIECMPDYNALNEISSIVIENDNQTILAGFNIQGRDISIEDMRLTLTGNANPSCTEDLLIDVGNDKEAFLINPEYTNTPCTPIRRGCFNPNLTNYLISTLGETKYCEKITLPPAAAYLVGAKIINSTAGTGELEMEIFDKTFENPRGSCILPKHKQNDESLSCVINISNINRDDFFVCVSSSGGNYKIRVETERDTCGRAEEGALDKDYDIFIQTMQFGYLSLEFTESIFNEMNPDTSFIEFLNDYIQKKYQRNCPSGGCFIPFKITGKQQTILVRNPLVKYTWGGSELESSTLNKLSISPARISSNALRFDVSKLNINLPLRANASTLQFYIDGRAVLNSTLALKIEPSFSFDIYPKFALVGVETIFNSTTNMSITSSSWDFGDGKTENANGKSAKHMYTQIGNYSLKVTLMCADGLKGSRIFEILVGDANASAQMILTKYENRLANLTKQIALFQPWIKEEIDKKIDLVTLEASVAKLRNDYSSASSEDEFAGIVNKLLQLNVPAAIVERESGTYPFSVGFNELDTSLIEEVSAKTAEDKEQLAMNIIDWANKNYEGSIKREVISVFGENSVEDLMTSFAIILAPKQENILKPYLILDYPNEGMKFKGSVNSRAVNSGTSISLTENQAVNVEFIINQKVDAKQLGMYISPDITNLIVEAPVEPTKEAFDYKKFLIWGSVVFFLLIIVYIILQEWYKKHYESYLFKTKEMLYNILAFINNSRTAGIDDSAISKNLSRAGWDGEQIAYAFKKIEGKRTGMFEIPIFGRFERNKINNELAKRADKGAGAGGFRQNARFIKRPGL